LIYCNCKGIVILHQALPIASTIFSVYTRQILNLKNPFYGGAMKYFAFSILGVFALFVMFGISLAETDSEYDKAIQLYNSKKYTEAIRLLKEYVEKKPDASAYYRIGYALYKLRKFNEADKYFEMAYLIDPIFSPKKFGLPELPEHIKKSIQLPSDEVPSEQIPQMPETMLHEATPKPFPERQPSEEVQPPKPQDPTVTPSLPEPQKVEPPSPPFTLPSPPAQFPSPLGPMRKMPGPPPGLTGGLFAGFTMIMILVEIALYIYFSLCLFLIAKKLNVPAPWIAFIPIVQIWTFVASAGKPWWWLLLLLIPIVNIIVGIYLWICITENLSKNKWLGLLMLVPIINLVFLGMLAFSRTEGPGYTPEVTGA
jgi:hypothetical protein